MGHKAIAVLDMDHIDLMKKDPAAFVQRLELAMLAHRRTGGSVSVEGTTVANVVWSGHVSLSPVLKFDEFGAVNTTYTVGP